MSILCAYVFLLLSICGSVSSFLIPNLPNFIRDGRAVELKYRRRADLLRRPVVEHLVDCASDPRLAELYGNGEVCIQNDWGGLISISGFVGQVATIGFLVMSYYFFKRTRGGILDWQDTEDDNDDYEDEGRDDSYDYFGDKEEQPQHGMVVTSRIRRMRDQCMLLKRCECDGVLNVAAQANLIGKILRVKKFVTCASELVL